MQETKEKVLALWKSYKKGNSNRTSKYLDLNVLDQSVIHFVPGSFFYYVLDFSQDEMKLVSTHIEQVLGVSPNEFDMLKLLNYVHPEDISIMQKSEEIAKKFLFEFIPPEKLIQYKIVYSMRMKGKNGSYYHNLHQAIALNLTNDNGLGNVICTETDISHICKKPKETISFIDIRGNDSYLDIDIHKPNFSKSKESSHSLTEKELEVLKCISFGLKTNEIAEKLNISANTVRTHRQNMLKKEKASKMTALVKDFLTRGII